MVSDMTSGNEDGNLGRYRRRVLRADFVLPTGVLRDGWMAVEDGRIVAICAAADAGVAEWLERGFALEDWRQHMVLPGLIDVHMHGIGGHDCMDMDDKSLPAISLQLANHGVTGYLATTVTQSFEATRLTLERAQRFMAEQQVAFASGRWTGARLLGVHMEGPFLSPQRRGAQNGEYLQTPDVQVLQQLLDVAPGCVRLVTLAPELAQADALVQHLVDAGIRVSMGHTDATYEQAEKAIQLGVQHVTHCFNAMSGLHHRSPGVVGATLLSNRVKAELIADGIHVHPAAVQVLLRMKGRDGVVLISDSIRATGMPDGEYALGGLKIRTIDGTARLPSGELAGSTLTLDKAVQNLVQRWQTPLADAAYMASASPAEALRLDGVGRLAVGYQADYSIWDAAGCLQQVVMGGTREDAVKAAP